MKSESAKKATQKYNSRVYEQVSFSVKKGKREVYKQLAESRGQSLAGMISGLLDDMSRAAGLLPEDDRPEE